MAATVSSTLRRGGAGFQAALGRQLVHQTIRQRIAERHAQLQHVHARLIKRERQLAGGFEVRVARADVNDEALLPLALEPRKAFHNAIHAARSFRLQVAGFKRQVAPGRYAPHSGSQPTPLLSFHHSG